MKTGAEPNMSGASRFGEMLVSQVMQNGVQYAHRRTTSDLIASMMLEGFGSVPVVDEQHRVVGIVSEHDLLSALDGGHQLDRLYAEDIMSSNPYTVRAETNLATLIHVLRSSDLIRVPVVDAGGKLIGIVARRDILRMYLAKIG